MSRGARVLVVDDEPEILRCLELSLEERGYQVVKAITAEAALEVFAERKPDVMIVDLLLPGANGIELTRTVRQQSNLPIILLSAIGDADKKIEALEAGADDYVTKPFNVDEVVARIRSILRRSVGATQGQPVVTCGELRLDFEQRDVRLRGERVRLTPMEFELLKFMVKNAGKVLTRRMLLTAIWGPDCADKTHYLRVLVRQVRKKIESTPAKPRYIVTDPGVGYRFRCE
jgi:two-component system KDP operon response regulator KdpE